MGATTQVLGEQTVQGNKRITYGTIALSSSYATGGDTFTAARFGLSRIDKLFTESAVLGRVVSVDMTNLKLLAYGQDGTTGALVEAPNTTNLSTIVLDCMAIGA